MNKDVRQHKITSFTDLLVWQKGHALVVRIYLVTKAFPTEEVYGLTSQIRRAAVSITSNIAEGFGRQTYKEKIQFYYIAQGSLTEVKNQLLIAKDVGYIADAEFKEFFDLTNEVHAVLHGLLKKTKELAHLKSLKS